MEDKREGEREKGGEEGKGEKRKESSIEEWRGRKKRRAGTKGGWREREGKGGKKQER